MAGTVGIGHQDFGQLPADGTGVRTYSSISEGGKDIVLELEDTDGAERQRRRVRGYCRGLAEAEDNEKQCN